MKPSDISWNWRFAGFGAVMALAALITILSGEVLYGTFLLLGSIPAAIVGLAPERRERKVVLIVGLFFGVSILLGSILALWVPLAIVGMFVVSYWAAQVAAEKAAGVLALSVIMPLTAIGLTYSGIGESAKVARLMILGGALAAGSSVVRRHRRRPLAGPGDDGGDLGEPLVRHPRVHVIPDPVGVALRRGRAGRREDRVT
ncbi:MAG: hypothetical protein M5U27_08000 [Gaiella sp.]|nr:hypothetical protein [Gaiella sp.]